ncbi:hypothetical protein [Rahnella aquatilis]|uniref:hypothetical protein n=1 Tax=Rahnella aquatilis TaxID=34038 RepID=UPI00365EE9F0
MKKTVKWFGCFLAIFIIMCICYVVFSGFLFGYIFDGVEYRKSNWFDYYYLTPDIIKNAPEISTDAIYYVQGGDENTFLEEKVTWTQVKDVPQAVKILKTYLVESGIDVEANYKIGERYFIIPYEDKVSLLVNTCMKNC